MRMDFDCIIVLPNKMDQSGELVAESKLRVEIAADYYFKNTNAKFITSGANCTEGSEFFLGNQMKNYAMQLGVPAHRILTDLESKDTVGDALFTKINIVKNKDWQRLLIVTSDYHIERARKIFSFIYGAKYLIEFVGVKTKLDENRLVLERNSYKEFLSTFKGIDSGHDEAILKRLLEKHPFYCTD